jgi:hypothetical protein
VVDEQVVRTQSFNWDRLGVFASSACMVHCALVPVLVSLAPSFAHFLPASEAVHRTLVFALAAIGGLAFRSGFRVHRRRIVLLVMVCALACLALAAFLGETIISHRVEIGITTAGSVLLITAHVMNRTFCRHCRQCSATRDSN